MSTMALLQAATGTPTSHWEMVAQATPLAKAVLVILGVLSLVSWAVMIAKALEFRRAQRVGTAFMYEFERTHTLEEAAGIARRMPGSGYGRVLERGELFLAQTRPALGATSERSARLSGSQVEALRLVLDAATNEARDQLGRYIPWLAVIGSVSPLIGLLGTVLGVVDAFVGIATQGSGNLSAVAPGIAEALIATAAALAVAIPAVFGYNIFASRLNRLDSQLEGFGSELIALMVREGRI